MLLSLWLCNRAHAQCRAPESYVDTSRQHCGLAPRIDAQLDVQLGTALGRACLQSGDDRDCDPGFPTLGAQLLVQLRLWRQIAIGPVVAYDQRIASKTFGEGNLRSDYSSTLWRAMLELRWYRKSVVAGGLFIGMRAGAAWLTDSVLPLDDDLDGTSETQVAPVVGLSVGGVFAPISGLGGTLALQTFLAPFPKRGPEFERGFGRAPGYGSLLFVGVTAGLILGTGL